MISLEEVYKEYSDMIYRWLLARTGDENVAEEITQETFYQAIRTSDRYDGSCSVITWLCGIAKNVHKTYLRKHPTAEDVDDINLPTGSAEEEFLECEAHTELIKKLHALPEPYREVMYLRALGGLSFREIGRVHGKTENWARVTFFRGKEKLRKEMQDE